MNNTLGRILIIAGDNTCFDAMNEFALSFDDELRNRGYESNIKNIYDLNQTMLNELVSERYKAIVGFQTNLFTLEISENLYVGNLISVPKYNYILDPPATKRSYFDPHIKGLTYFYHDLGYVSYIKKYFPHCRVMYGAPGGGVSGKDYMGNGKDRSLNLSFIGTYSNYRDILKNAYNDKPEWAEIIEALFEFLVKNPNTSAESAIEDFADINSLDISFKELPVLLEILFASENAAKSYYREKIVKTIIDSGLDIDVFSRTWEAVPFASNNKLRIHSDISYRKSMEIMADSNISLNVFSWHKASMTERIANIMLNGAVCLSDRSSLLIDLFDDNKDIVLYELDRLEDLPEKIIKLTNDNELRINIANAGNCKAIINHRWQNRVDDFIRIMEN